MLTKISRKRFLNEYPDFPITHYRTGEDFFPETYNNYILAVDYNSTRGLCNNISKGLTGLTKLLGYSTLHFLGDGNPPWLSREHDYNPVKRAFMYLTENNISKSFNGAIQVKTTALPEFVKNLFWLVRCNGVMTIPHFSDPGFNIIGSICQYGNLHFHTLHEKTDTRLNEILDKSGLYIYKGKSCGNEGIVGRTTIV